MLPEERRTQLDGIVQQMVRNKEPDSNISFVVDDFKKKYTPVDDSMTVPNELPEFTGNNTGNAVRDVFAGGLKSLVGSARGTAQMVQGLGQRTIALATPMSLDQVRANTGFKSLDDTTPEGMGVAESLRAKSKAERVGKVIGTVGELASGFTKEVAVGAQAVNKVRTAMQARKATKAKDFVADLVLPKASSQVAEEAIRQGRVTEPKLLRKAKITPSKRDLDIADSVREYVSPKGTVFQNTDAIDKGIRKINEGVKQYVTENKVPFNSKQLRSQLNAGKDELKLVFASDTNAEKTYSAVVDEFMKHVGSKDTAGLLEARKRVDRIPAIKKLLDSQAKGENVKKEVVLTVRRMANQYISDLLPADNTFKQSLLKESRMIEAIENIAEKNRGMIGKNNLQLLAQKYPILKWAIGGTAAGIAGGAGVGVGSAIIGSTD